MFSGHLKCGISNWSLCFLGSTKLVPSQPPSCAISPGEFGFIEFIYCCSRAPSFFWLILHPESESPHVHKEFSPRSVFRAGDLWNLCSLFSGFPGCPLLKPSTRHGGSCVTVCLPHYDVSTVRTWALFCVLLYPWCRDVCVAPATRSMTSISMKGFLFCFLTWLCRVWSFCFFVDTGWYGRTGPWPSRIPFLQILGISVVLL